jgi:predicted dehydrogenase
MVFVTDVIQIGCGPRTNSWLRAVERHASLSTVATVAAENGSDGARLPDFSTVADAVAKTHASLAIATGPDASVHAAAALEAGLKVLLAEPGRIDGPRLRALRAAAEGANRRLTVMRRDPLASCKKTVQRFLRAGRLGALGHVSYIDESRALSGAADSASLATLHAFEAFESLQEVLGLAAVSVMARMSASHPCAVEAFLEMEQGVHVHYYGRLGAAADSRSLWLEGSRGSLKTDGAAVAWRKRGWRFFVPVRVAISRGRSDARAARRCLDGVLDGTLANGARSLAAIATACESAAAERAVALSEILGSP